MAAEPAGARQLAFVWRCWRSWRLERAMWKTKRCSTKWRTKTSSVTKGLRQQNVQLVQHAVPRSDGKRIHIKVQIYTVLKCKTVQCSVHESVQCWNVKGERRTMFTESILGASGVVISTRCKAQRKVQKQDVKVFRCAKQGAVIPIKNRSKKNSCPPSIGRKRCPARQTLDRLEAEIFKPKTMIEQTKVNKHVTIVITVFYNNQLSKQKNMQGSKTISKLMMKQTFSNKQNQFPAGTNTQTEARKKKVYVYMA